MPKICSVEGCEKEIFCRGYCRPHYRRLQRYNDPLAGGPYQEYKNKGKMCRINGCKNMAATKGLCSKHYQRLLSHGNIFYSGHRDHRFLDHCREWRTWDGMKQRCYNPKSPSYKNYGGRGVKVCDRWLGKEGFFYFYLDMGPKPKGKFPSGKPFYSIDRIDPNGDYCPENCRWATALTQQTNRTNNNLMPGISYNVKNTNKKWTASITIHGKRYYKSFKTIEEALAQRKAWEKLY